MTKEIESAEVPKVTVMIPTYNRADVISRAIESVMKQSLHNWKALIIDDGSTDHTEAVIQPYLQKDGRVSYYRMPENKGICHVLNHAMNLVDTEYMCQLDSDDWLEEKALEMLLQKMEAESKTTALAYGNYQSWWSDGRIHLQKLREFRSADKYELIIYSPMMYPRFYRMACLQEVGGWETNDKYNGRYMEDRRILFKLIEKYDFVWVDEHLYNLSRLTNDRLSSLNNKEKYLELKKELIIRTLERWGGEYVPVFISESEKKKGQGWLPTQLVPNKKMDRDAQRE